MLTSLYYWLIDWYIWVKLHLKRTKLGETYKIKLGTLKGKIEWDVNDRQFHIFHGIPYGEPPIGSNRFKAPKPAKPWSGVLDATTDPPPSCSRDFLKKNIIGSEDCLYLNVGTPNMPDDLGTNPKLPVMVWIHGGGFVTGSNSSLIHGLDFLVAHDVVVVTINYRLGLLGFLSLEDPTLGVPGNNGLKDMVLALKWVQDNIDDFGGDPGNVTIFGQSAGGCAVHLLTLSPMAKGLFHKAVALSGCALNPWAITPNNGYNLIKVLDRDDVKTEKDLLDYLMKLEPEQLVKLPEKIKKLGVAVRPLGPVVETPTIDEPPFLTEHPLEIIKQGKFHHVPFIVGYTSCEGMIIDVYYKDKFQSDYAKDLTVHVPNYIPDAHSKGISDKIKEFYFKNRLPTPDMIDEFYALLSDSLFNYGIALTIKLHAAESSKPIYFHRFSVDSNLNIMKYLFNIKHPGTAHADDLNYIFRTILTPKLKPDSVPDKTVKRLTKLLTNFAYYGNPTPNHQNDQYLNILWKPVTSIEQIDYLEIGDEIQLKQNPDKDRIDFWKDIHELHDSKYV